MLTESEVQRSWRLLWQKDVCEDTFHRAETLVEELRPESPLRHRLLTELDELRKMHATRASKVKA